MAAVADVERLAADPNLHIRQNACVPLIEFVRLRLWTDEAGRNRMPEDVRARAKALPFKMLRDNRDYPGVLDRVATIFTYLPDLEQSEAEEVLGSLLAADLDQGLEAVAWLLVFFSVFRPGHPQFSGTFDPSPFAARLTDTLLHGSERLRHSIAFTIFRSVEEDPSTAQALKRYILMLPESDLTGHAPNHFYKAVQPLVDAGADDEVERAVLRMISTEVAWSVAGPGRFMILLGIAPVLKRLGAHGRWDVVLNAVETLAAAHPPLIGSLGELESLVRNAPETHVKRLREAISSLKEAG